MRLARRGFGVMLASTALLLTAQPALAAPAGSAATPITWKPCTEDRTAECGTLRVPINWAKPHSATFGLAVARRKATSPAKRIGTLFINPGGPGGSGVEFALEATSYFSPELRQKFDIIGFDPRGIARSNPVVCTADLLAKAPSQELHSQADFNRLVTFNRVLGKDCRKRTGPLFDHVDTLSVVRDMDALRVALGEKKINYYGISYGTLIGQQFAERFPKNFRTLVIDSNMDHSLGTRRFLETETVSGEANFGQFVKWCARDTTCALHKQGADRAWDALVAKADRGQLRDPMTGEALTAFDLSSNALGAFYGPSWKGLAAWLASLQGGKPVESPLSAARTPRAGAAPEPWQPRTSRASAAGAAHEPAQARTSRAGAAQELVPARTSRAGAAPELAQNPIAVFCEDWRFQIRDYREAAQYWANAKRLAPHMRMSPIAWSVGTSCLGFGAPLNNPQHPLKVRGAAPILMTNARYDPATGYIWAVNASRQLGRASTLLTYEGWGHGTYGRGPCTTGVADRYLVDRVLPARGSRCPAVPPVEPGARSALAPVPGSPLPWVRS